VGLTNAVAASKTRWIKTKADILFFIEKGFKNGFVVSCVRLAEKIAEFWLNARLSTTV
jgi:hypothetical protein